MRLRIASIVALLAGISAAAGCSLFDERLPGFCKNDSECQQNMNLHCAQNGASQWRCVLPDGSLPNDGGVTDGSQQGGSFAGAGAAAVGGGLGGGGVGGGAGSSCARGRGRRRRRYHRLSNSAAGIVQWCDPRLFCGWYLRAVREQW